MIALIVAATAGYGTLLLVTAILHGWHGLRPGPRASSSLPSMAGEVVAQQLLRGLLYGRR